MVASIFIFIYKYLHSYIYGYLRFAHMSNGNFVVHLEPVFVNKYATNEYSKVRIMK